VNFSNKGYGLFLSQKICFCPQNKKKTNKLGDFDDFGQKENHRLLAEIIE
jgi:hypothetical protein